MTDDRGRVLARRFYFENTLLAVIKGVPYLGDSLEQFIVGPRTEKRQRRLEETLAEVASAVAGMRDTVVNERFVNLIERTAPAIALEPSDAKRARFRDLLISSAELQQESTQWSAAELATELLLELDDVSMQILAAMHRARGGFDAVVSAPSPQLVMQKAFDWAVPASGAFAIPHEWVVVERRLRRMREMPLVSYNTHDARGGFGGLVVAPLGQFLLNWTLREPAAGG